MSSPILIVMVNILLSIWILTRLLQITKQSRKHLLVIVNSDINEKQCVLRDGYRQYIGSGIQKGTLRDTITFVILRRA